MLNKHTIKTCRCGILQTRTEGKDYFYTPRGETVTALALAWSWRVDWLHSQGRMCARAVTE